MVVISAVAGGRGYDRIVKGLIFMELTFFLGLCTGGTD